MTVRIVQGDCRDVLRTLPEASVDSIVTDPPYHLTNAGGGPAGRGRNTPYARARAGAARRGFMGKTWDGGSVAFDPATWELCLRVLRPGGYLLAFGHARTYHRLVCAVEDAGFAVRDTIARFYDSNDDRDAFLRSLTPDQAEAFLRAFGSPSTLEWVYGSGFPKSRNLCRCLPPDDRGDRDAHGWRLCAACGAQIGLGTALKPAHEPILVAQRSLEGTVAANVARHGTGAFNIDDCRVEAREDRKPTTGRGAIPARHRESEPRGAGRVAPPHSRGRWPANLIHDGSEEVLSHFPDAPGQESDLRGTEPSRPARNTYGNMGAPRQFPARREGEPSADRRYAGTGGTDWAALPGVRRARVDAARFFYCARATAADRHVGTGHDPYNHHPTVKPLALMRYLVRLVTPPAGTTLDPFGGSGSTGRAADVEGIDAILIDDDPESCAIARRRVHGDAPLLAEMELQG